MDRTIHAWTEDGRAIVRYDRAGKWYAEAADHRRPISFGEAVRLATLAGSTVYLDRPGGKSFSAKVRAA